MERYTKPKHATSDPYFIAVVTILTIAAVRMSERDSSEPDLGLAGEVDAI
jgi:hypothetical protein